MKRIGHTNLPTLTLMIALALLFAFCACGKRSMGGGDETLASASPNHAGSENDAARNRPATESGLSEETLRMQRIAAVKETLQDIHFDFDRYDLVATEREILKKNHRLLETLEGVRLTIEGHCDERGEAEYNLALGQKRAEAVRIYLVGLGMDGDRIDAISYGEENPLDPGHFEAAWAKNRRARLVVVE